MVNSSTGDTIYSGVSDDGVVHGVLLSRYKVDHTKQKLLSAA